METTRLKWLEDTALQLADDLDSALHRIERLEAWRAKTQHLDVLENEVLGGFSVKEQGK